MANFTNTADTATSEDVVKVLNDLLETSRDGEYGFRVCAEEVDSPQLKQVFQSRSADCAKAAGELVELIRRFGGSPDEGGTVTGAMHRGWVHVKGAVGANSAHSMLEECERGEDTAVARYRKALKADLPADVRALVQQQSEGAKRNHDQIKQLRDQMKKS